MKSDLVIVYHRQPYEEVEVDGKVELRPNKSPNGIVPTLKSFFSEVSHGAWVAWKLWDEDKENDWERVVTIKDDFGEYSVSRLGLTAEQVSSFYHVTSKEALWPILHSFVDAYDYGPVDWPTFQEVNFLFAQAAAEQSADDAIVWIHDYNLWLVPTYLRQMKPNARISFFHHTPFPAPDVFNVLPWRNEIMESLLSCDQVGFHIPRYAVNFANAARTLFDVSIEEELEVEDGMSPRGMALSEPTIITRLKYREQIVNIDAFPVGTNVNYIEELVSQPAAEEKLKKIKDELGDKRLIVSIARTDYTKGTREVLETFERLLERRKELHGNIRLMCVSVTANMNMAVYRQTQEDIEGLVGRINGRFSTFDWVPIVLFTNAVPLEELVCYFQAADVCWLTPLRDGLNLVCKEFCAARTDEQGVLVISEFMGAAVQLPYAVLTNPYSERFMDAAIDQALDMAPDEQKARMQMMRNNVRRYDITHWANHTMTSFNELAESRAGRPVDHKKPAPAKLEA